MDDADPAVRSVAILHPGESDETARASFLGREVEVRRIGCDGEIELVRALIAELDGRVAAIGVEGMPFQLELGGVRRPHATGAGLPRMARQVPVVDGGGLRAALERWAVTLADRAQPGIFAQKRVLMVPGLNHGGLAQALDRHASELRYADPILYFALPDVPGVGHRGTLGTAAAPTLERLRDAPFQRLLPAPGPERSRRAAAPFRRADVLAGDIGAIRRHAPERLDRKTVVVESATEEDLEDLARRGVSIAVTLMPSPDGPGGLGRWSAATVEAVLAALRRDPRGPLTEDAYLDLLGELDWAPAVRVLQPEEAGINRFAFVIHPLSVKFIHKHPAFAWTRLLPDALVEAVSAYMPPFQVSTIRNGRSPLTGQRIEGLLYTLGATPRQLLRHSERFTYKRLNAIARMAERKGARILGLGAFTKVVGDAGITVAHEADIAVTSGNSLTVAATLEAAKQAVIRMGVKDLTRGRGMVIGATGAIGAVCSRLLAQAVRDVVLVSIEPERLITLKQRILEETPGARVVIATQAGELAGECDLVVTATSAFGQRVLDLSLCKPGAVICDVALPSDIQEEEAALRPDLLVVESGEVLIPGPVDFGYDIGLPPGTAYACLAEAALLAMEGRFEDFTLGRNLETGRVKEMYRLFQKHGLRIAGLRSFGRYLTEEDVAARRERAGRLRADPELLARVRAEAAAGLARIPPAAKGVRKERSSRWLSALGTLVGAVLLPLGRRARTAPG
ncbi:MAG: serine carboxypeptidase [Thermoanaerobaculia bacterium]